MTKNIKEMQVKIDEETLSRHERLFVHGDYSRIADLANTSQQTVSKGFKNGTANVTVARAMKEFYKEKEAIQEELNA